MLVIAAFVAAFGQASGASDDIVGDDPCRLLAQHVPSVDVVYAPGFDVRGSAVLPADLNPYGQPYVPRTVAIDLSAPLNSFLADALPERLRGSELFLGLVEVDLLTGLVLYNDQPLTDPERHDLIAYCEARAAGD